MNSSHMELRSFHWRRSQEELKDCQQLDISRLPESVLLHIMSFLKLKERIKLSYVCKQWYRLCTDSDFWRHIHIPRTIKGKHITNDTVKRFLCYSNNVQCLNLSSSSCKPISDKALQHVSKKCPGLRELNIAGRSQISNRGLKRVARQCKQLRYLNIQACSKLTDSALKVVAMNCQLLTSLNVSYCQGISDEGIVIISQNCGELRSLSIAGCKFITDAGLEGIGRYCNKLQTFNIKNAKGITHRGIELVVRSNTDLTHVYLGFVRDGPTTLAALHVIVQHCPKLQFIAFKHFNPNPRIEGGVRKIAKKKLGPFIDSLSCSRVAN